MKKLVLVLAIALIAAFSAPAFASDFSAGGHYRFEGIYNDAGGATQKTQYFDQRMRVAFNWQVNDNVSAILRGDFAESAWGGTYRPAAGHSTIMIDRAGVKIKQGAMTLEVGIIEPNLGLGTNWSYQMQGLKADFDMNPVTLSLIYGKESENGSNIDSGATDDLNLFAGELKYSADGFTAGVHAASQREESNSTNKNGYGFYFVAPVGPGTLQGEIVTFDGTASATTDYAGTQMHVTFGMPLSEALSAGVTLVWAQDVNAADEVQITTVQDDANFVLLDFAGALGYNNGLGGCGIFNQGGGSGVKGIVGNVKFAATEALTLYAKLGYAVPNDDSLTTLDSNFYAIANFDYAWMPAVTFSSGIAYVAPDYENALTNDSPQVIGTFQLGVSF